MALIQNIISYLSPFNQLLLLQKFFTNGIIYGIKTIIPDYTNDDSGMYKIINYYGKNKDNLSKIYFFLSLFAKQLNYGEYDEKTQKIIEHIKKSFFNLINDIYNKNIIQEKIVLLKPKIIKSKIIKSKISKITKPKSKISKITKPKSKISKITKPKSKISKIIKPKSKISKITKPKIIKSKISKITKSKISKITKSKISK